MSLNAHLRGGALLGLGTSVGAVCSFARNILIARLISVEDFGIAATFAMATTLVEMASNIGLDRYLVQTREGNNPQLQASAQTFQALRGLLGAALLLVLAEPVARLFGVPEAAWAYRLLALLPLIRGVAHMDVFRLQRELRFGRWVLIDTIPQLASIALAAPLALWMKDYRVMLWLVILQATLATVLSHSVAKRRYAWHWSRKHFREMLVFGWPLLVNSLLLFGLFQGEKVIVGTFFSMEQLGWFAVAFALTVLPASMVPRVLGTLSLPTLAQADRGSQKLAERSAAVVQMFAASAIVLAVAGWCLGPIAVVMLYGEAYAPAATLVGLLALSQALRVVRTGMASISISQADTKAPLYANVCRVGWLPIMTAAAGYGLGMIWIAVIAVVAEIGAVAAAWAMLGRAGVPRSIVAWPMLYSVGVAAAIILFHDVLPAGTSVTAELVIGLGATLAAGGFAALLASRWLRVRKLRSPTAAREQSRSIGLGRTDHGPA